MGELDEEACHERRSWIWAGAWSLLCWYLLFLGSLHFIVETLRSLSFLLLFVVVLIVIVVAVVAIVVYVRVSKRYHGMTMMTVPLYLLAATPSLFNSIRTYAHVLEQEYLNYFDYSHTLKGFVLTEFLNRARNRHINFVS